MKPRFTARPDQVWQRPLKPPPEPTPTDRDVLIQELYAETIEEQRRIIRRV